MLKFVVYVSRNAVIGALISRSTGPVEVQIKVKPQGYHASRNYTTKCAKRKKCRPHNLSENSATYRELHSSTYHRLCVCAVCAHNSKPGAAPNLILRCVFRRDTFLCSAKKR